MSTGATAQNRKACLRTTGDCSCGPARTCAGGHRPSSGTSPFPRHPVTTSSDLSALFLYSGYRDMACKYFLPSVGCLFPFFMASYEAQRFLILILKEARGKLPSKEQQPDHDFSAFKGCQRPAHHLTHVLEGPANLEVDHQQMHL